MQSLTVLVNGESRYRGLLSCRSSKKPRVDDYDPDDKEAVKQRKKQEAAEAREQKKAAALAEKERKKLLRCASCV